MKVNYLSYDDRLRLKSMTQCKNSENMCRKNSIVSEEKSSVNKFNNGSDMRKDNNVAAINFAGKQGLVEKIFNSKWFNAQNRFFDAQSALAQNGVALVVAGGLRPITNIAMANDEDREDCMHAATHAISSAGVGFGTTCLVMKPITDGLKKFKNDPGKYMDAGMAKIYGIEELGARKVQASKIFKNTCKFVEMLPEISIGVPKAMLTIALIPPILKYCFGIEKKSKTPETAKANIELTPQDATIKPEETSGKEVA